MWQIKMIKFQAVRKFVMVEEIAFMNCDFIWGETYGVRWRKRS